METKSRIVSKEFNWTIIWKTQSKVWLLIFVEFRSSQRTTKNPLNEIKLRNKHPLELHKYWRKVINFNEVLVLLDSKVNPRSTLQKYKKSLWKIVWLLACYSMSIETLGQLQSKLCKNFLCFTLWWTRTLYHQSLM